MPLRDFPVGPAGEDLFPKLISGLAEAFDDPARDRNIVVRDALAQLYLGREIAHDELVRDVRTPPAIRALVASFDPRNATLESEYYKEIDLAKWAKVKPLLWFWQMFDHSPVGRNVRLGTQMRYMLAKRIFKKCGEKVRIFHEVEFSFGYNLSVGDGVTIHRNVLIDDRGEVVIGDDASISDYANIYSHAHAVEDIHDVKLHTTEIGARARVTYHSVILSGVKVGADAIVGSMGVASKPVEAGWIVGGIPAKQIATKSVKS